MTIATTFPKLHTTQLYRELVDFSQADRLTGFPKDKSVCFLFVVLAFPSQETYA
jgi:hypothetical protein